MLTKPTHPSLMIFESGSMIVNISRIYVCSSTERAPCWCRGGGDDGDDSSCDPLAGSQGGGAVRREMPLYTTLSWHPVLSVSCTHCQPTACHHTCPYCHHIVQCDQDVRSIVQIQDMLSHLPPVRNFHASCEFRFDKGTLYMSWKA